MRRQGVASAILEKLGEVAKDNNAALIRWITEDNNKTARALYDQVAKRTEWITYDLAPDF